MTRIMGTLQEEQYTFITISCSVLRMKNISDESCSENQNTNFVFHHLSFENRSVYEIMWKQIVQLDMPQMKI
jgi:hypothetical protein